MGLLQDTGYGAGAIIVVFPNESLEAGHAAVAANWLIENWSKWVGPDAGPEDVWVNRIKRASPRKLPSD